MSGLTRREMKRDEVREWLARVFGWSHDHRRGIFRTAGAILAVILLVVLVLDFMARRERKAQALLDEGLSVYTAPVVADGEESGEEEVFTDEVAKLERAEELFAESNEYGGTDAGRLAAVYLGEIAQRQGDSERALELWRSYLDGDPKNMVAGAVWLNVFDLERQLGSADRVAEEIRSQLESGRGALPDDALLWELGVTLEEQQRGEEARDTFQRLVDDFPSSPYSGEARSRLGGMS